MMWPVREQQREGRTRGAAWGALEFSGGAVWMALWGRHLMWIGSVAVALIGSVVYTAEAQSPADSSFHEAAQQYVEGNTRAAQRAVEQGLETAPSDPRLRALRKKLQQARRTEGAGEQDSSSRNTGPDGQQDENTSSEEGGRPSGGQNSSGTNTAESSARSSSQQPGDAQGRVDTLGWGGQGRPVDTLSHEQAERLLRALEGQERQLLRRLQTRASERRTVEKDW